MFSLIKGLLFKSLKHKAGRKVADAVIEKCVEQGMEYMRGRGGAAPQKTSELDGLIVGLNNLTARRLPDGQYPIRLEHQTLIVTIENHGIVSITELHTD
ncbi:hypothetical protein [Pseudoalteromonas ardens]|uniref:Uncharacterized protein n=1 Tax=Pseudoalteromonas rubra TaxID=43658 RepID=A0A0L0EW28_9GAMM|nr:hypothetical protein [Pseudoalteromonas sp. R96]KNC68615.1 hypothetical protein AC626_03715 [Pseudoalteromonas rubra]MDK1310740.1 hypothetical protein [Pseudoalteromonas sp. R96]